MQCTDDSWPRQVALATDVEGLAVIAGLLHDAGFDAEDVIFDEHRATVEIELWRLGNEKRYRRWIWPLVLGEHAQTQSMLRIRHVEEAHIRVGVMPTDLIVDVSYESEERQLVLKPAISEPVVLRVSDIWAELEDLAPPIFDGPNTVEEVGVRWRLRKNEAVQLDGRGLRTDKR